MWRTALSVLLVAYLPGAVVFRSPLASRNARASLAAEERLFWSVVLSLVVTSIVGLGLASAGWYRFDRLLWIDGALSTLAIVAMRGRLRLPSSAPRPGWTAAVATSLLAVAMTIVFQVPPSEYVMGGKDPGTYMNEGIQIAQRGTLIYEDPLVASIPAEFLDLSMPDLGFETYYSSRFMGFYLVDEDTGTVLGQFPHLFPLWIAVGYGAYGLTGARYVVSALAILGVMAVYFCGVRLVGRPAAAAGSLLLAINVVTIWYSRYPNAEILMQVLVFAGLLALNRARANGDTFFAAVAALLFTLSFLTHLTGLLIIAAVAGAAVVGVYERRALQFWFLFPLAVGATVAASYYATLMAPYVEIQIEFVLNRVPLVALIGALLACGALLALARSRVAHGIHDYLPPTVLGILILLVSYAYFFRAPGGALAQHDADALRTFTQFYLSPLGLLAATLGLAVVVRRSFWPNLAFIATFTIFACMFFYKMRVIPEHFWAARRFLAVVLPGACLLIGAAAFPPLSIAPWSRRSGPRAAVLSAGVALVTVLGLGYLRTTMPILRHVEYAGLIPALESLNSRLEETDLILVESRQASDLHTLALPLAYIYDRNVLVLRRTDPNRESFSGLVSWAEDRYERVLFMGGGGSLIQSRSIVAVPLSVDQFSVPEYESAYNAYPRGVRYKRFDVVLSELRPRLVPSDGFDLDVGEEDGLFLSRFFPAEQLAGTDTWFRWSRDLSTVSVLGVSPEERTLTLWMSNGGRPVSAGPARVTVTLNDRVLGDATVSTEFEPYRFVVPLDVATETATREAGTLSLRSTTWTPAEVLGGDDVRELGVMVDRITVE